jgi:hypothetical protein
LYQRNGIFIGAMRFLIGAMEILTTQCVFVSAQWYFHRRNAFSYRRNGNLNDAMRFLIGAMLILFGAMVF